MTRLLSRAALALVAVLAASVCVIAAIGFLTGALYLWLRSLPLTPAPVALIVGLVLLGIAGLAITAAALIVAGRNRTAPAGGGLLAAGLAARAVCEAAQATEAHPYGAASLALLAGLALGSSPDMQEIIKAALRAREP